MNSRAKGKRGELAVAHLFQEYGFPAERGQQHDGMSGHADVVGVPYIWIEAKWRESLNLEAAMEQAERDSAAYTDRTGKVLLPVVIHKKNREAWQVTMRVFDFCLMLSYSPFEYSTTCHGLVHMLFKDWMELYMAYVQERRDDEHLH